MARRYRIGTGPTVRPRGTGFSQASACGLQPLKPHPQRVTHEVHPTRRRPSIPRRRPDRPLLAPLPRHRCLRPDSLRRPASRRILDLVLGPRAATARRPPDRGRTPGRSRRNARWPTGAGPKRKHPASLRTPVGRCRKDPRHSAAADTPIRWLHPLFAGVVRWTEAGGNRDQFAGPRTLRIRGVPGPHLDAVEQQAVTAPENDRRGDASHGRRFWRPSASKVCRRFPPTIRTTPRLLRS